MIHGAETKQCMKESKGRSFLLTNMNKSANPVFMTSIFPKSAIKNQQSCKTFISDWNLLL